VRLNRPPGIILEEKEEEISEYAKGKIPSLAKDNSMEVYREHRDLGLLMLNITTRCR
jgi:hypothetical protein